jgi:hypothetical protein
MTDQSTQSKKRKREQSLQDTTITVLKNEIERLETKLTSAERALAEKENLHLRLERRVTSAENQAEAMFDAVRILAKAVPSDTALGRRVRQEARVRLEDGKITPPSTLGSSRNRPKKSS